MKRKVIEAGLLGSKAAGRSGENGDFTGKHGWGWVLLAIVVATMVWTSPLWAGGATPLETVQVNVDRVLAVLRDPAMQEAAAVDQKKETLRTISDDLFHWDLLSKMVLAKSWSSFTTDQQQEFISLFKEILEQAYIDRILAYKDEQIEYASNQMLSENKAEVETHIVSSGSAPITLTYRLGLLDGTWGVYDVIAEGVSLTANYRKQFREFLSDKTPVQLLEHLKGMVEKPSSDA